MITFVDTENHQRMMAAAEITAQDGTCDRAYVGAVIVRETHIIGTGFNTAATGLETCAQVGHLMIENHCCRTIHAEVNAILDALHSGHDVRGATMYVTHEPCVHCRKMIIQAGIKCVLYKNRYRSNEEAREIHGDVEWIHYRGESDGE